MERIKFAKRAFNLPANVPLVNRLDGSGDIVGTATIDEHGRITTTIANPSFVEKLGFAAGSFSLRTFAPATSVNLCYLCGADKCDRIESDFPDCMCCNNGHVV